MSDKTAIHVIDDDSAMRDSLAFLLDVNGYKPLVYEIGGRFLERGNCRCVRLCGFGHPHARHERHRAGQKAEGATAPRVR